MLFPKKQGLEGPGDLDVCDTKLASDCESDGLVHSGLEVTAAWYPRGKQVMEPSSRVVRGEHWTGSPNKSINQTGQNCQKNVRKVCVSAPPDNFWTFFGHFFDIFRTFFDIFRTFCRHFLFLGCPTICPLQVKRMPETPTTTSQNTYRNTKGIAKGGVKNCNKGGCKRLFAFVHVCSRLLAFACVCASAFACVCPRLSAFACVCSRLLTPPFAAPPSA